VAGRVTLVSAPAGYGKTTALAAWARARPTPAAWLALDERDAWPAPFLRHVAAALAAVEPGLVALADPLDVGVDAALAALLNALDAAAGRASSSSTTCTWSPSPRSSTSSGASSTTRPSRSGWCWPRGSIQRCRSPAGV
jgi:hypothetical protein